MPLPLPGIRRLTTEKLSAERVRELGEALLNPLNRFIEPAAALFDRGLTAGNLNAQVLSKKLTIPEDWTTPTLATGASSPAAATVPMWRKTYSGEVEGIGVVTSTGLPQTLYTLPEEAWPEQALTVATSANGAYGELTISAAGVVTQTVGALTPVTVAFRFAATDRSPWLPSGVFGADCEFSSTLRSACVGIWPLHAVALDGAGKPSGEEVGSLPCPDWTERLANDKVSKLLRINNQVGLLPGQSYLVTWLALGE